jgi:hypothetical protein
MTINGKYVVWSCCDAEVFDNKEDAFGHAYFLQYDDDQHSLDEIEGPRGIIDHGTNVEYRTYVRAREERYKRWRENTPKIIGVIEVQQRNGKWSEVDQVCENNRDKEIAYYAEALGSQRVRFIPKKQ